MRGHLGSFCLSWKHHAGLDAESASRDLAFFRYHGLVLAGIPFVRSIYTTATG